MTSGGSLFQKPSDQSPSVRTRRKSGPWKQIAIVLVSAIILSGSSCAAMSAAWGAGHENLFGLATLGFFAGLVAIPFTIIWAIVTLILALVRKRGARE
jgi:preprotein translocase subunit SecG